MKTFTIDVPYRELRAREEEFSDYRHERPDSVRHFHYTTVAHIPAGRKDTDSFPAVFEPVARKPQVSKVGVPNHRSGYRKEKALAYIQRLMERTVKVQE